MGRIKECCPRHQESVRRPTERRQREPRSAHELRRRGLLGLTDSNRSPFLRVAYFTAGDGRNRLFPVRWLDVSGMEPPSCAPNAGRPTMLHVTLDVFSGRENPSVTLDGAEAEEIASELARHRTIIAETDAGHQGLGFRGVVIETTDDTISTHYDLPP